MLSVAEKVRIDGSLVEALHAETAKGLRYFLVGLLRDDSLAGDVLQATFAKLVEVGHRVQTSSLKAWLFRVAYREAMAVRRRQAAGQRAVRHSAWSRASVAAETPDPLLHAETIAAVREALDDLPSKQARIVRMRIHEEKTFAAIAEELQIPLGTALGRMRAALAKLRKRLQPHEES